MKKTLSRCKMSDKFSEVSSSQDLEKEQDGIKSTNISSLRQSVRNKKPDVGVLMPEEFVKDEEENDSGVGYKINIRNNNLFYILIY